LFYYENMLGKLLGFDRMHKDKKYFLYFWKEEINFFLFLFLIFLKKVLEKTRYFNIRFIFYSVSLQPNIMQNHWKNMRGAQNVFKCPLKNLKIFPYFKYLNIIILLLLNILDGLAKPSRKIL